MITVLVTSTGDLLSQQPHCSLSFFFKGGHVVSMGWRLVNVVNGLWWAG